MFANMGGNLIIFGGVYLLHAVFFALFCMKLRKNIWYAFALSVFPTVAFLAYRISEQAPFKGPIAISLVLILMISGIFSFFGTTQSEDENGEPVLKGFMANLILDGRISFVFMVPFVACFFCALVLPIPTSDRSLVRLQRFEEPQAYPVFFTASPNRTYFALAIGGVAAFGLLLGGWKYSFDAPGLLGLLAICGFIFVLALLQLIPERRTISLTQEGIDIPKFPFGRIFGSYERLTDVFITERYGHKIVKLELLPNAVPDRMEFRGDVVQNPEALTEFLKQRAEIGSKAKLDLAQDFMQHSKAIRWKETFHPIAVGLLIALNVLAVNYAFENKSSGIWFVVIAALIQVAGMAILVSSASRTNRQSVVWAVVVVLYFGAARVLGLI